jgi:ankyrin repeat protein
MSFETANADQVRACLAQGVDVSARDDRDVTRLHSAASLSASLDVIAALVAGGADLSAQSIGGYTPLHWAPFGWNVAITLACVHDDPPPR